MRGCSSRLYEGNIRIRCIHRNGMCRESTRFGNSDPDGFGGRGGRRDIFFVTVLISRGLALVVLDAVIIDEESWTGYRGCSLLLLVSIGLVFGFLVLELLSELSELKLFLLELSLLLLLFQKFLAPLLALSAVG